MKTLHNGIEVLILRKAFIPLL